MNTTTTKYLNTGSATGKVHLILADGSTDGVTVCGRAASFNLGDGRRKPWPRWSPSDRGIDPIHRASCPACAKAARAEAVR